MAQKTEVIKRFLDVNTHSDLSKLYSYEMEVQVNVAQDGGERTSGDYRGKMWHGFTDGIQVWKSFRIPYKANSEPEYEDKECNFDFGGHVEAIGLTGWNWVKRCSMWMAFDFDSIVNHSSNALAPAELEELQQIASKIPWVTVRRSTSGKGIHLYVQVPNIPTQTHTEHAALARAILGMMSAETGYNFNSKVDACGGNMWIWHRKMKGTNGLTLIKSGRQLSADEVPLNWKEHVKVVSGKRKRTTPQFIKEDESDDFEKLSGLRPRVKLDDTHRKLLDLLKDLQALWWWDNDHHMLVTHTSHLADAFARGDFKGDFKTAAIGKEKGADHNCYMFPLRGGGWVVRRYTPGVKEADTWDQDNAGWTRCYFNVIPDLKTISKAHGAIEDPKGGFVYSESGLAAKALSILGIDLQIPLPATTRPAKVSEHKDGRLIVELDHAPQADSPQLFKGWLQKNKKWFYLTNLPKQSDIDQENEIGSYDDTLRHLVSPTDTDCGWVIQSEGSWNHEPYQHVKTALASLGLNIKEVTNVMGGSVLKPWKLVSVPFQPEYPGDRQWNRNAAQLKYVPITDIEEINCPTWNLLFDHLGRELDKYLLDSSWAVNNGLKSGGDYLRCWVASIIQRPFMPLPYLFFYSPEQGTGKSSLAESLSLIMSGCVDSKAALTSPQGFNAELAGSVVCYVEEYDLNRNKESYNRIKHWCTSPEISIHPKRGTPYIVPNSTHWIQTANDHRYCPIFPGDTRIMMIRVHPIKQMIPKYELHQRLVKEASHFVALMLNLELPAIIDRLGLPIIETEEKAVVSRANQDPLQAFIDEYCVLDDGYFVLFSDFYERFTATLAPGQQSEWSKIMTGKSLPPKILKGRWRYNNAVILGNIRFTDTPDNPNKPIRYVLEGDHVLPYGEVTISHATK